jgi:hypothetical protein
VTGLLDPVPAAEAGAGHGQIASGLAGGGLVLSGQKIVEDGARALVLLAPGLFRLDVKPVDDTLQVMTRSLHPAGGAWAAEENPMAAYGQRSQDAEVPLRMVWRYELRDPPLVGRVQLLVTVDREEATRHFAAHAVIRPAAPAG